MDCVSAWNTFLICNECGGVLTYSRRLFGFGGNRRNGTVVAQGSGGRRTPVVCVVIQFAVSRAKSVFFIDLSVLTAAQKLNLGSYVELVRRAATGSLPCVSSVPAVF